MAEVNWQAGHVRVWDTMSSHVEGQHPNSAIRVSGRDSSCLSGVCGSGKFRLAG